MTLYAADEDGACICVDCIHGACVGSLPCEAEHCQCECNRDENGALLQCDGDPYGNPYPHTCAAGGVSNCTACAYQPHVRARELDDRPPDKLAVIAAEIELEAKPSVEELLAERYPERAETAPATQTKQRPRHQDPAVRARQRIYKGAYNRAMARLRDQNRGQFADLLRDEIAVIEDARRA